MQTSLKLTFLFMISLLSLSWTIDEEINCFDSESKVINTNISDLNSNLVAYYPFNGGANDLSGNAYNGVVYGATLTEDRFGNPNAAYLFDGVNDYIRINDLHVPENEFTISLWAKPTSFGNIISKHDNTTDVEVLIRPVISTNNYEVEWTIAGQFFEMEGPTLSSNSDKYDHLVVVFDGNRLRVFVNNRFQIERRTPGTVVQNNRVFTIGGQANEPNTENYGGAVDDIRIYDKALSCTEIESLFHEGGLYNYPVLTSNVIENSGNPNDNYFCSDDVNQSSIEVVANVVGGTSPYQYYWKSSEVTNNMQGLSIQAVNEISTLEAIAIDNIVQDAMNAEGLTGLAIGFICEGELVYSKGYGFAAATSTSLPSGTSFSTATKARWASISKIVTAIIACKMWENGDFCLDDLIENYVDGFTDSEFTIKQLLTHQSGLGHYDQCDPEVYTGSFNPELTREIVTFCQDCFTPSGSQDKYTSFGTNLLGVVLDAIGQSNYNMSFVQLANAWISSPLNMNSFAADADGNDPLLANGYNVSGVLLDHESVGWKLPGGGFMSNINDLGKFACGIMNFDFVSPKTSWEMWQDQYFIDNNSQWDTGNCSDTDDLAEMNLGLTFFLSDDGKRIWHNGSNPTSGRSRMHLVPDEKKGMVMLCNTVGDDVGSVLNAIRNDIYDLDICSGTDYNAPTVSFSPFSYTSYETTIIDAYGLTDQTTQVIEVLPPALCDCGVTDVLLENNKISLSSDFTPSSFAIRGAVEYYDIHLLDSNENVIEDLSSQTAPVCIGHAQLQSGRFIKIEHQSNLEVCLQYLIE